VFFLVFVRPLSVFVFFLLFRSLYSFLALVPLFLLLFFRFFLSEVSSYLCSSPSSMFFYSSLLFPPLTSVFYLVALCFSVRPLVLSVCSQSPGLPLFALVIYM